MIISPNTTYQAVELADEERGYIKAQIRHELHLLRQGSFAAQAVEDRIEFLKNLERKLEACDPS